MAHEGFEDFPVNGCHGVGDDDINVSAEDLALVEPDQFESCSVRVTD